MGLEKRSCRPHNVRKPTWLRSKTYELVIALRKAHPTEGKEIIHATLLMQGKMPFSVTTVGGLLRYARERGEITTVQQASGRGRYKGRRVFKKGHVQRWRPGMQRGLGCLVQIDHMSMYSDGKKIKHFNAVCPGTRAIVIRAFSSASSRSAGEFLREMFREMPVCVKTVQVDTGSEFRGEFEEVAKELGVKICVTSEEPGTERDGGTLVRRGCIFPKRSTIFWRIL